MNNMKLVNKLQQKMQGGYSNQCDVLEHLLSIMTEEQKEKIREYCGLKNVNSNKIDFNDFTYNCEEIEDFDLGVETVKIETQNFSFNVKATQGLMYLCKCILFLNKLESDDDKINMIDNSNEYKEILKFTEKIFEGLKVEYCYEFYNEDYGFYYSVDAMNEDEENEGGWIKIILE